PVPSRYGGGVARRGWSHAAAIPPARSRGSVPVGVALAGRPHRRRGTDRPAHGARPLPVVGVGRDHRRRHRSGTAQQDDQHSDQDRDAEAPSPPPVLPQGWRPGGRTHGHLPSRPPPYSPVGGGSVALHTPSPLRVRAAL